MSPRSGRPIIGKLKNIDLKVRVDKETNELLEEYAKAKNMTKAAVVRLAIDRFIKEK